MVLGNGCPKDTFNVMVKILVSRDGDLVDINPEEVGFGIEQEIKRILKEGPKWLPSEKI